MKFFHIIPDCYVIPRGQKYGGFFLYVTRPFEFELALDSIYGIVDLGKQVQIYSIKGNAPIPEGRKGENSGVQTYA